MGLATHEKGFQLEKVSSQMVDLLHLTGFYPALIGDGPQQPQAINQCLLAS